MSDRVTVDSVIVTCAVRYALGRRSYLPGLMRDALIDAWGRRMPNVFVAGP